MPTPTLELIDCRVFRYADARGGEAVCGLRAYRDRAGDRPHLVVVTELPWNPGVSPSRVARRLRSNVCAALSLDAGCLHWFEHRPPAAGGPERFLHVEFLDGGGLHRSDWARAAVERLAGGPLADPPFLAAPA
jgi:hypothetical protein